MEFWKIEPNLEILNQLGAACMPGAMGIEFIEVGVDYLKASMPVSDQNKQPMGLLHGGASAALAETMGSVASTLLIDITQQQVVGVDINSTHMRGVRDGMVIATVRPLKIGRRIHVWEIDIENEETKLVNRSRLTTMIIAKPS